MSDAVILLIAIPVGTVAGLLLGWRYSKIGGRDE